MLLACVTQDIEWEFVVIESSEIRACVYRGEYISLHVWNMKEES